MEPGCSNNFNIPLLLRLGDLDIRGMAAKNGRLLADEYFSRVERFITEAPQSADELSHIAGFDDDMPYPKQLAGINSLLTDIGYNKLSLDIGYICNEVKYRELELASKRAGEVLREFNRLYERTKGARVVHKPDGDFDGGPEPVLTLEELLVRVDEEEANRKPRILAVDDSPVILRTISMILNKHYEVFALTRGDKVEDFLSHTSPDLFLLDVIMPDMDGYELIKVIRQLDEYRDTPVIYLTGNATAKNLKTACDLGACDFLIKPVDPDALLAKIEKWIDKGRNPNEN